MIIFSLLYFHYRLHACHDDGRQLVICVDTRKVIFVLLLRFCQKLW